MHKRQGRDRASAVVDLDLVTDLAVRARVPGLLHYLGATLRGLQRELGALRAVQVITKGLPRRLRDLSFAGLAHLASFGSFRFSQRVIPSRCGTSPGPHECAISRAIRPRRPRSHAGLGVVGGYFRFLAGNRHGAGSVPGGYSDEISVNSSVASRRSGADVAQATTRGGLEGVGAQANAGFCRALRATARAQGQ